MRHRCVAGFAAALAAAFTVPAAARVVDYAALGSGNFAAEAANLKITPISAAPIRGNREITTEIADGVDHEVLTLGNYCSAYKVENPMAAMLRLLFAEAGRDGSSAAIAEPLRIKVVAARSNQRCVEIKEYNVRCIARVTITGEGEVGNRKFPLKVSVERDSSVGGFCEDRSRGVGIISREAGLQFLAAARAAADAPTPAPDGPPPQL